MKLLPRKEKTENDPKKVLLPLMLKAVLERKKLRQFQSEHEQIFTEHDKLVQALEVAENELRTASKKVGEGYETDAVSVEYVMPQNRYHDAAVVRKLVDAKILDSLGVIIKTESVDVKVLKALIRAKKINKSVLDKSLVETPTGSPRVTITFKD